jgi:hypothetical protein
MLSTLYPQPVVPPARELQIMTRFGALFGEWLSPRSVPGQPESCMDA